jgi:hypothetical protein
VGGLLQFTQIERLTLLRTVVGYLGEQEHFGWWQSAFFGSHSKAFLAPVFGKTQLLAQCNGVTRAAALIHDERIGVGHVYHLFRLPEDMEQSIHRSLHDSTVVGKIEQAVTNQAAALAALRAMTKPSNGDTIGPTRIGNIQDLRSADPWAIAAAHYVHAFERRLQIYPYFSTAAS